MKSCCRNVTTHRSATQVDDVIIADDINRHHRVMMIILDRLSKAQSSSQGTRLCKDGTHVSLHYSRYRTGNVKAVGYILTVNYGGNKPGDLCITRPGREMATGSIGRFYVQLVLITITSSVCPYLSSPLLHQCQ